MHDRANRHSMTRRLVAANTYDSHNSANSGHDHAKWPPQIETVTQNHGDYQQNTCGNPCDRASLIEKPFQNKSHVLSLCAFTHAITNRTTVNSITRSQKAKSFPLV